MPKFNPSASKLVSVHEYFLSNPTAHSIKDLEKNLPGSAGISGMQVKDYLTALSDDGKIRVEKIGSGNWYWCFRGDEKNQAQNELQKWKGEKKTWEAKLEEVKEAFEEEKERGGDAESLERYKGLTTEKEKLLKDLQAYADNDPTELKRRIGEIEKIKAATNTYIDNIFTLEGFVKEKLHATSETIMAARKQFGIPEDIDYV